jgi:hypothetical protein
MVIPYDQLKGIHPLAAVLTDAAKSAADHGECEQMRTNADYCCGFVGDVFIVEGESSGTDNFFAAMVNFVLGGLCEDGREGMDSLQLVIRDDHEEGGRVSLIASRSLSVGFPLSGGGGVVRLFEVTVVFVGVHFLVGNCCRELLTNKGSIFLGKKSWVGAVKGCNDDDQSNSVGKGKLRVLGAFGDSSESVGSYNCDCGSGSLVSIKFKLDFHCHKQQIGPESAWHN